MRAFAAASLLVISTAPAMAQSLPQRVGACVQTTVRSVETRLQDGNGRAVSGSGSAVRFANRGYQVGYDTVEAIEESRRGDRVLMCLVAIPDHCPPGDTRGRTYTVTNLRTQRSWTRPDASHECGGA